MLERLANQAVRHNDKALLKEVQRRFMKKFSRFDDTGKSMVMAYYPSDLSHLKLVLEHWSFIFRRPVDIKYHLKKQECNEDVWYGEDDDWMPLDVLREDDRMIFENPYTYKVESWSKPVYLTRRYGKHLSTSRNPDASTYLSGLDYAQLEQEVFTTGKGFIDSVRKLFLYGRFEDDVGRLPDGVETSIVKLDVIRIKKGYGTYVHVHGYPVSYREVSRDCPKQLYEKIMENRINGG